MGSVVAELGGFGRLTALIFVNDHLYAGTVTGQIIVLDPASGKRVVGGTVPDGGAYHLAFGGGFLWASTTTDDVGEPTQLAKLDPNSGRVVQLLQEPGTTAGIAYAGAGLWATVAESTQSNATLELIDPMSGAVEQSTAVGADPFDVHLAFGSLWVANHHSEYVTRVDPASGRVVATVHTGRTPSYDGWITDGAGAVWVSDWVDNVLFKIDPATNRAAVALTIPNTGLGQGSAAFTLAFGAGALWVVDQEGNYLIRVDPSTDKMVSAIPIPDGSAYPAFGDGYLWVASGDEILKVGPSA
jgi:DNA-binding beta-propeller fold protein YncE